ncbi:arsenite methyltransferase-like [Pomacea canaliculata]|uniref:arsenite methyltransferase-like n=1 Tax=Pomacea canaliculata TaxID=400727 RepID=UPI000D72C598|nr:arsenite methyltransferase-like [Pomacea canaliculata]
MAESRFTVAIRAQYNDHNDKCDIIARKNSEDLTPEQNAIFDQLSDEIKKRYYGAGLIIPENLEGKRVLDIGCGSGSLVFILSKLVGPTGYVVGMDISDKLIETAKSQIEYHQKAWGYSKPNCEFSVGNAEKLDFEPDSFDLIVSNGVYCLCPDKKGSFQSAYSVLKEGGQFYLSDVYAERQLPAEYHDNEFLWSCGAVGAMKWDHLALITKEAGFTTPYLRQVGQAKH